MPDMSNAMGHATAGRTAPKMPLRYLRWNLHHLSLAYCVLAVVGVRFYGLPALAMGGLAAFLILLVTDGIARPGSSLFYPTLTHGPRSGGRVALSFDDGPDPVVTPQVLDALAQHGARATFFVIGRSLAAHPELGRRIAAEGHALGNHSWQHSRWQSFYSSARHMREIERGEEAIVAATGTPAPELYRAPVGLKGAELARAAWRRGLTVVAWSLHSHDTRLADAELIARRVLDRVREGDIVLLHDGHDLPGHSRPFCAEAVRLILKGLREKNLECVTIPELLGSSAAIPRKAA